MNLPNPPFDPPFVTTYTTEEGVQHIETLEDGTIRPFSPPPARAISASGVKTPMDRKFSSKQASKPRPSQADNHGPVIFLKVSFAEKDQAKALGARWDAGRKQWYVPQDKDVNLFSRWLPDAMKER